MGKATIKKQDRERSKVQGYDDALRNHVPRYSGGFDVRKSGTAEDRHAAIFFCALSLPIKARALQKCPRTVDMSVIKNTF